MSGNGYYPFQMRQGSKMDFRGAWLMRLLQTLFAAAILWVCKLTLAAVMYLVNTLPPMQADVNDLKKDMKILKDSAATKAELVEAELRVKNEFRKQLDEQLRNGPIQTGPTLKKGRP